MSLISDGGTIFSTPFAAISNVNNPYLSFFAWVKFRSVTGGQAFGQLANAAQTTMSGIFKAGNGSLGVNQTDRFNTQLFSADLSQVASTNTWYPIYGSVSFNDYSLFKSSQTPVAVKYDTGPYPLVPQIYNEIQFLGRRLSGGPISTFMTAGSQLAEFAVWTNILSSAEYDSLIYQGTPPGYVQKRNLLCYCPLRINAMDLGPYHFIFNSFGTRNYSFDGDHPIITRAIYPIGKPYYYNQNIDLSLDETTATSDSFVELSGNFFQTYGDTVVTSEQAMPLAFPAQMYDTVSSSDMFIPTGYPGNWSDTVTTKDKIPLLFGNKYDNEIDEFITSSDNITSLGASVPSITDSNSSSDAITVGPILRSYSDTVATSDAYQYVTASVQSLSDQISSSDQTQAFMYLATLTDTAIVAETLAALFAPKLTLADSATIAENLTIFFDKQLFDTSQALTFFGTVLSINQQSLIDFMTSSDRFAGGFSLQLSFPDAASLSDAFHNDFMMAYVDFHETPVATSDNFVAVSHGFGLADVINSSDTFSSVGASVGIVVSPSVVTNDTLSSVGTFALSITDNVPVTTVFNTGIGYINALADVVTTATTITQTFARIGSLNDTTHATDQFAASMVSLGSFADAGVTSDTYPQPILAGTLLHDNGFLSDILTPSLLNFNWSLADYSGATDLLHIEGEVPTFELQPNIPPSTLREQKLRERWLVNRIS